MGFAAATKTRRRSEGRSVQEAKFHLPSPQRPEPFAAAKGLLSTVRSFRPFGFRIARTN